LCFFQRPPPAVDQTGVIAGVWSPVDPRFVQLQRMGWELWDSTYFLAIVNFGRDMRFLRDHWVFTMGDSDLI